MEQLVENRESAKVEDLPFLLPSLLEKENMRLSHCHTVKQFSTALCRAQAANINRPNAYSNCIWSLSSPRCGFTSNRSWGGSDRSQCGGGSGCEAQSSAAVQSRLQRY